MAKRTKLLIVDDEERIRVALQDVLQTQGYEISQASNGIEALQKVKRESPDVIILDINMPRMNGLEVTRKIKVDDQLKHIPLIILTGLDDMEMRIKALKLGADDFLIKPPHMAELTARVRSLVKVKAYNDHMRNHQKELEAKVAERTQQLKQAWEQISQAHRTLKTSSLDTIYRLARAAEYKDEDTSVHLQRMSNYAAAIAQKAGLNQDKVDTILYASPMHDIGKIGIPDRILLKPDKLTPDEWKIMKQHTSFGAQILGGSPSDLINVGERIAQNHHEKWDGTGYPLGLKGKEIPIEGRITAIADVFDALTSKRPYKKAFSENKAFRIMKEECETRFDPELLDVFLSIKDEILAIKHKYKDNGKSILLDLAQYKSQ